MEVTIESIVERWSGLERPLFKGKLIDTERMQMQPKATCFPVRGIATKIFAG